MELIIFLYVVGYLFALGMDFAKPEGDYHWTIVVLGNLFVWPLTIGRQLVIN